MPLFAFCLFFNLIRVSNTTTEFCQEGDSGGPVYRVLMDGSRQAMGTVSGRDANSSYPFYGYYSPIAHAYNAGFIVKTY